MKKINIVFVSVLLLFLFDCGKSQSEETEAMVSEDLMIASASREKKSAPMAPAMEESAEPTPQTTDNRLGSVFLPLQNTQDRYLEFQIDLSYQTMDLIKTRNDLLLFVSKYGFIESSSATNTDSPSMNVRMRIKAEKLYDALLELDRYGTLQQENINTIDHTEGLVWEKIKSNREKIRYQRRVNASGQSTSNSKNWSSIEEAITTSENGLDQAEHQIWKIQDRVKWATVSVSFSVPTPTDKIIVPMYQNALVGITNLFLEFTYLLVWMIPWFVLAGILYLPGKKCYQWFRQKN